MPTIGAPVATGEHMLLHVDTAAGRTVAAAAEVLAALDRIAAAQAGLPAPDGAGRGIGLAPPPPRSRIDLPARSRSGCRRVAGGRPSGAV